MEEALRFFKDNEVFIYLFLGIVAVWQLRKFTVAWGELRGAAFGLERESAHRRLSWVASMLIFLLVSGVAEFALVSFVVPTVPEATPLSTPTLDLLATPTSILEAETPDAFGAANATPLPIVETENGGCIPGLVDIISPADGDTIQGIVEIIGTADIPNFGFYKFEMAALNDVSWLTIQAGDTITHEGRLGYWDTARLTPGDYALRLVVTDNQGE
ncbi:MAG: hypothetical protein KJ638_10715, partial [Chloroflexi bacterium]|nr:hypothetical protein [Chloroflexota bacterium]